MTSDAPVTAAAPGVAPAAAAVVAAVVLAAGRSRRMGEANKLLADIDGAPMVVRVVDALQAAAVAPIIVVTGHDAARVRAALAGRPVSFAHNPDHDQGMGTSLRAGVGALPGHVDAALMCLGDMPRVGPAHIARLVAAFDPGRARAICVPVHQGKRGNPVLFDARFFADMDRLRGDVGARALLEAHGDMVHAVPMDDSGVLLDVDTAEALAALRGE